MTWLCRNTKLLDSFAPLKNEKSTPVLCDQVTRRPGSLTISLVSMTSMNDTPSYEAKESWITQHCTCP